MLRSSTETSATRARPQRLWILPYHDFGRIDVLINDAGVFIPKPFTEYTTEDFNTLVSTTLAGFLYVSQLSAPRF
jgi:NAD(P)-dependent dehydrogenase (short-subunit alcohol dehydrogenase family)